ncbi:hypothetical protein M5K25_022442 [Dendrobium thyrsiflorum]|uniref:CCHC-type domain-containing protein n=1 Tax=Dendrobium thyrsiflorum TaxID=117978 RepID=A0ABD0U643_DENTH
MVRLKSSSSPYNITTRSRSVDRVSLHSERAGNQDISNFNRDVNMQFQENLINVPIIASSEHVSVGLGLEPGAASDSELVGASKACEVDPICNDVFLFCSEKVCQGNTKDFYHFNGDVWQREQLLVNKFVENWNVFHESAVANTLKSAQNCDVRGGNSDSKHISDKSFAEMAKSTSQVRFSPIMGENLEDISNEGVLIPDQQEIQQNIRKLEFALVGKVLGKKLSYSYIHGELQKKWNRFGDFKFMLMGGVSFICIFSSLEAQNAVLNGGPWTIAGRLVGLSKWTSSFDPNSLEGLFTPIWVRFPNLPLLYWDKKNISRIAFVIGRPLWFDEVTNVWVSERILLAGEVSVGAKETDKSSDGVGEGNVGFDFGHGKVATGFVRSKQQGRKDFGMGLFSWFSRTRLTTGRRRGKEGSSAGALAPGVCEREKERRDLGFRSGWGLISVNGVVQELRGFGFEQEERGGRTLCKPRRRRPPFGLPASTRQERRERERTGTSVPRLYSGFANRRKLGLPWSREEQRERGSYARVCVSLDVSKKLPKGTWINGIHGKFFQNCEFEEVPLFCFGCGLIGHKQENCPDIIKKAVPMATDVGELHQNSSGPSVSVNTGQEVCPVMDSNSLHPWVIVKRKTRIKQSAAPVDSASKKAAEHLDVRKMWRLKGSVFSEGESSGKKDRISKQQLTVPFERSTTSFVHHLFDVHKLFFFALVETKVSGFVRKDVDRLFGQHWDVHCLASRGLAGGIMVFWKTSLVSFKVIGQMDQCILGSLEDGRGNYFLIATIYASTKYVERRDLWLFLQQHCMNLNLPLIVGGDFNCVLNLEDKKGGKPFVFNSSSQDLWNCMISCDLKETSFSSPRFTWTNNKDGASKIWVRHDRFLVNSLAVQCLPSMLTHHLVRIASDHAPILLYLFESSMSNKPLIRFEDTWVSYHQVGRIIKANWFVNTRGSASEVLITKYRKTLRALFFWSKNKLKELNESKLNLEASLLKLQE